MELVITEKIEQPLLSRIKVVGEITFDAATPSNDDLCKAISTELKCAQNVISVQNIYTKFGEKRANISAYVYDNEENMKKIERIKEKKKKEGEEEAPKEEAKKETPKEEDKTEKKKEESKPDEKKAEENKNEAKPEEKPKEEVKTVEEKK